MKKFFKNILLFILLVILLAYPLDLIISNSLKNSNYAWGEYNTWNDIYDGKIHSEIVIYGSSRAWRHIDPNLLQIKFGLSAYNLGIDGQNFWLEHLRHKTLLKFNQKPKYIIMSVDLWSLEKRTELYNAEQFLPYMLLNKDIINYTSSYKEFTSLDYYLPLIRYVGNKKAVVQSIENSIFFPKTESLRNKGYKGWGGVWNNDLSNAKQKMKNYEVKLDIDLIKLFDTFLFECKKKKIKVILVYTPEYVEGQSFIKNRKEILNIYENFSKKHKIPFLDYSNNEICAKKEYFYNASHLNKTGAEIFTKILINDLSESGIIVTPPPKVQ